MPRAGNLHNPAPYQMFGSFAGLSFWPGGLTLLAAAPGIGKTSWLLRMVAEAAAQNIPAAIGCYEHTAEELRFRLEKQAEALAAGPHSVIDAESVGQILGWMSQVVLLPLSDREDSLRSIEEQLIETYDFPRQGRALLAVDYLQRIPVVGIAGLVSEDRRAGEAAANLRHLSRRRGWGVIAAAALKEAHFEAGIGLGALLGDERVPYEADRVLFMNRAGDVRACGCVDLRVDTLKNRTGPAEHLKMQFWGERFFPVLTGDSSAQPEQDIHDSAGLGAWISVDTEKVAP